MAEITSKDEEFMHIALEEAELAASEGEIPVGAVIVCDGKVIARARNSREADKNALAHAELAAIDQACRCLGGWRLPRCTLYVTLEPCPMCAGAIINARIPNVVYALKDAKSGAFGSVVDLNSYPLNHKTAISCGLCEARSRELMSDFFVRLRESRSNKRT